MYFKCWNTKTIVSLKINSNSNKVNNKVYNNNIIIIGNVT